MKSETRMSKSERNPKPEARSGRSADFQVCSIAGFQTRAVFVGPARLNLRRPADLEVGDTAGLETCATPLMPRAVFGFQSSGFFRHLEFVIRHF